MAKSPQEEYQEELLNQEESPSVKAAVEQLQQDYQADVELQKANLQYYAKHSQAMDDHVQQEKDSELEAGEFDTFKPGKVTEVEEEPEEQTQPEAQASDNSDSEPEPEGAGASMSPKPAPKQKRSKLFVLRKGTFVPSSSVHLIDGEDLFRLRPRKFGVSEKFIKHGKQKKES